MPQRTGPPATAGHWSTPPPASPTNTEMPENVRAGPSATPGTAAATATIENMDGQRSSGVWRLGSGVWGFNAWLGFFDEFHRRPMQAAQFIFTRFVFGELHEIAAFQKVGEAFLLFHCQQIRA